MFAVFSLFLAPNGNYDQLNSHIDIETYDILNLHLKTFKMRYYMTLDSKIQILPILGDCPFSRDPKNGLRGWKKLAFKIFVFWGS